MSHLIPAPSSTHVALDRLDSCVLHAPVAGTAKRIARSWLADDDITAFMAEPDDWTVEEFLAGRI